MFPGSEAIPALAGLRDQGVIGAAGVGMNQWQALLRMVRETDLDVVMLAGRWTLLDRSAAPLLTACAERGVAVVAAAPYNSGLLARDWPAPGARFDYGRPSRDILARARALASGTRRSPRWSPGCGRPLKCGRPRGRWPRPCRKRVAGASGLTIIIPNGPGLLPAAHGAAL